MLTIIECREKLTRVSEVTVTILKKFVKKKIKVNIIYVKWIKALQNQTELLLLKVQNAPQVLDEIICKERIKRRSNAFSDH